MVGRLLKNASHAASRRWAGRKHFARLRDWMTTIYDATLRYAKGAPLPLRGRVRKVYLANDPRPIFLRMGSSDGFVLEEIFLTDVYAPLSRESLGEVKQIVDLGANAGFSIRLWRQRFPTARVVAVEPDAENFAAASRNVDEDPQVCLVRAAVAERVGKVYLDRSAEECAIAVSDQPVGEAVDALPLEMILERCEMRGAIDILKVDIEGSEGPLLEHCAGWINRVRHLMIELHSPYSVQWLRDVLQKTGVRFDEKWSSETAGNPLVLLSRSD